MVLLTLENNKEDFLKDLQVTQFDESMSIMDCGMFAIAESERMWNDIMKEMAITELRYLSENGTEMIYEAVDFKKFFSGIKTAIQQMASNFAGMVKRGFEAAQEFIDRNARYVKKYEAYIRRGHEILKDNSHTIELAKYYKFENLTVAFANDAFTTAKDELDNVYGKSDVLAAKGEGAKGKVKEYLERLQDKSQVETISDKLRAKILSNSAEGIKSGKDFRKAAKEYFLGTVEENAKLTASDIKLEELIKELKTCYTLKKETKDAYSTIKTSINTLLKDVNTYEKAVSKADEAKEAKLSYANNMIKILKNFITTIMAAKTAQLAALRKRASQLHLISTKLVALVPKVDKKEEKTNESATYQFENGMNFFTSDLI